ncbi:MULTISPECIES: hypothetical protein [Pseudonocardia]|uniref:Anti-sigma-M factor RsmA n=1 Tax=Pseudonocardia saturnea TaxID=33909 RepID=A0ABQ0RYY0_9PSEU|nr:MULTISPECIES: hypothetical protein [Pseudonocardia]BBG05611.1 hypothetical protein Pdca_68200 [Pseudonocardia autotrophica]GEC25862.1 hypothetical protein PSA01_28910 [Pseudonocardia saturnea]
MELIRGRLGEDLRPVPMPDDVADRIRRRLHAELGERPATVRTPVPARPRSRPRVVRLLAGAGAAAVAATAVLAVLPGVLRPAADRPDPVPEPVAADTPEALRSAAPGAAGPSGPLADPDHLRACLTAAGVAEPDAPLLATRPYPVGGEPGVLLVLGTAELGRLRLLVVPPDCGPGTGRVLLEGSAP